jgi:hypothetical protein
MKELEVEEAFLPVTEELPSEVEVVVEVLPEV